ncbi:10387_t:CDS:2, partial [Ambispora leptoticha]
FLQELNEQQKQAVYEEHPRICVIAGPGCGKTKTLVSRLIYLLTSQKAQPQNILVLTFAKKAIKEIKKRVFSHITTASPTVNSQFMTATSKKSSSAKYSIRTIAMRKKRR